MPKACFHGGFTNEIDPAKLKELQQADFFKELYGWSVVITKGGNVQGWNPFADKIGAKVTKFNEKGLPSEVEIYYDPADNTKKDTFNEKEFHILRTGDQGVAGWQGEPRLLCLYEIIRDQRQVVEGYAHYAALMNVVKWLIQDKQASTDQHITDTRTAFGNPLEKDVYVYNGDMTVDVKSPLEKAWNPVPFLQYMDTQIAGTLELNLNLLTGDPEGHLSSSQVAALAFFAHVKTYQDELLLQLKPVFAAIGVPEDTEFIDPTELSPIDQATLLKELVVMLKSCSVPSQEIMDYINNTLNTEFTVDQDAEMAKMFPPTNFQQAPPNNEVQPNEKQTPPNEVPKKGKKAKPVK